MAFRRPLVLTALLLTLAAQLPAEPPDPDHVGAVVLVPPKVSFAGTGVVTFPDLPDVMRIKAARPAHREDTEGNVRAMSIRGTYDLVWLEIEHLPLADHEAFHDLMVRLESHALAGKTFSLFAEGDNMDRAPLWADAAAGATSIVVQFGFPFTGPPFPEGRDLIIHFPDVTDPELAARRDQFVGETITDLGFGQWQIDLDRPLAHDWPGLSDATVESRWAWPDCILLGDDGIVRYEHGGLFSVRMLVRTHAGFTTP